MAVFSQPNPTFFTRDRTTLIPAAVCLAFFIFSVVLILNQSGVVPPHPQDQSFAATADLRIRRVDGSWVFHYPTLGYSGGITSSLIAGLYKILIPTSADNLNWHIRILGAFLWFGSSLLLVLRFIPDLALRLLAIALIGTSGYQFVQPTSELFAGAFFALFLFSSSKSWPAWLSAFFLAVFGLAKVEMFAAAVATGLIWCLWEWRHAKYRSFACLAWSVLWFAVFLLPGFKFAEADPLSMSRSFLCFKLSYVYLLGPHQFVGPLFSEAQMQSHIFADQVMARLFPGADSVFKVITRYPKQYAEYLAVASVSSTPVVFHALKLMLLPMACVVVNVRQLRGLRFPLLILAVVMVLTLAPAFLVTIFRLRYFIKFWSVFVVLAIAGYHQLAPLQDRRYAWRFLWICGLGTIAMQLSQFQGMWLHSHFI